MRNIPVVMLNAADDQSRNGSAVYVGQYAAATFHPIFGDTSAAGTVKVQISNEDPDQNLNPNQYAPSVWADVPSATSVITAGVGPAIVLQSVSAIYMRVVFTSTNPGNTTIRVLAGFTAF